LKDCGARRVAERDQVGRIANEYCRRASRRMTGA
jgi:hypothetical protein